MSRQFRIALPLPWLLLLLSLSTQAAVARTRLMVPADDQDPKPAPGKALVVFLRPSFYGGAIASTVYDAPDGEDVFIGSVEPKRKLAYQAEPGMHRFMVVAENADFVDAELVAGKTYYLLVKPRPGVWKARFSLIPVHNRADAEYSVQGEDFGKWQAATTYVQQSPEAGAWYAGHKASVDAKKAGYLQKWNAMAPEDRAVLTLHAEDGVGGD